MDTNLELKYIKKLANGDHRAFDVLFTRYYSIVKSFLAGFIKDEDLASDIAQDVFFKIWVNREAISQVISFKAYLFRVARNMVYDYYEHNAIKEKYAHRQQEDAENFHSDLIEEELYARELSLLIDINVGKMPPQRRRIFTMSRKEGFSNDEIAGQLKISKRTVENHLTQALNDLRQAEVQRQGGEPENPRRPPRPAAGTLSFPSSGGPAKRSGDLAKRSKSPAKRSKEVKESCKEAEECAKPPQD
jgi:RNA polymerase sigma-70 factor (ECF subfamily)